MYAGSTALPHKIASERLFQSSPADLSTQLYHLAVKAVRLAGFPRSPTIDSFTAYMLAQRTWLKKEEPLTSVGFCGLALRSANMLGLHRDPSHFPHLTPIEAEQRRRLWWGLLRVDLSVASAAGLPPIIDASSWDVREVSELKEDLIGTPQGISYDEAIRSKSRPHDQADDPLLDSRQSMVSTAGILAGGKFRYVSLMRRTISRVLCGPNLTMEELTLVRHEFRLLGNDLAERITRIPAPERKPLTEEGKASTYESNPVLNKWARLQLSAFIDEKWCLQCMSVSTEPLKSLWKNLHNELMRHCRLLLMKFAQMTTVEELSRFHWAWPGAYQPLHALSYVLYDLIDFPTAPEADKSREVIDVVFALRGPNGSVVAQNGEFLQDRRSVDSGMGAWSYLDKLRAMAWRKAGLDPEVAWSRDEAIHFCQSCPDAGTIVLTTPDFSQVEMSDETLTKSMSLLNCEDDDLDSLSPSTIDWALIDEALETTTGSLQPGHAVTTGDGRAGVTVKRCLTLHE